ncbi:MAG: radical SAM protein [bacterium]
MKILIINPPWEVKDGYGCRSNTRWPHVRKDKHLLFPVYLGYVAAILEKEGIDTKVIDAVAEEYDSGKFVSAVSKEKPDICFIETSTPTINEDLRNAKLLKESLNTEIFFFGAHVTTFHWEIMKENPFLTGIIRGEFEYTIRDIALQRPYDEILGLTFREKISPDEIIINKDRPLIENLDELPFPAWHQFDISIYDSFLHRSPSIIMVTSRGCPFHCTFCLWPDVLYGHKQRFRSPENVCKEMEILINKYGIREIKFDDDTFALNKRRVIALCNEIIKRGYHKRIVWNCFGHISQNDEELYKRMVEAGCVRISFGVESGSQKILNIINKKIDMEKARETISICRKLGLRTYCSFMIGYPHETEENIQQSINAAIRLDPDFIQASYVIPYPGTSMYSEGIEKGYIIYPKEWERYCSCGPMISTGELSLTRIEQLYHLFWKRFYLRLRYVIKTLKRIFKSGEEFKKVIKGFWSFYKRFF